MIGKLKAACDYDYTYKLQRMFQDVDLSAELSKEFAKGRRSELPELTVTVMTTGSWPDARQARFEPPPGLGEQLEAFTAFYKGKHNGRKLTWVHSQNSGYGIIRALYVNSSSGKKNVYDLQVNAPQCAVLLCFNDAEERTWAELEAEAKLDTRDLEGALQVLVRYKLITTSENMVRKARFRVNTDFHHTSRKLVINTTLPREITTQEDTATATSVQRDRTHAIQAAIVRVMKARRSIAHQLLVVEVIEQLKTKFTPGHSDIKKQVDVLIDKEYLERGEDGKTYVYLA